MRRTIGEQGEMAALLIPVILLAVLFVGAASFAVWAYSGMNNYKNNVDAKISTAVTANTQSVQAADAKQYAQAAKNPLKEYIGPDAYGSVKVSYPKTWSAYVDTTNSNTPLDAYFQDGFVPSTDSQPAQTYDLRVQVNAQSYSAVMQQYASLISQGQVSGKPYSLPKVPNVVGTEITGQVDLNNPTSTGTMVLLPLRSYTLMIWTESSDYLPDFNTYVLPNLTFSP